MNRKFISILTLTFCVILACNKEKSNVIPSQSAATAQTTATNPHHSEARAGDPGSQFITADVANQMINSYVTSISNDPNYNSSAPDLHSFSLSADSLRMYLNSVNLRSMKLIFAHTMEYINAGNAGKWAGMQSGALTIILAGYDAQGNYVYYAPGGVNNGQFVLDHCTPCPTNCAQGVAGGDLLQ